MTDAIPPDVAKLMELFAEQPSLKFPDLDAAVLQAAARRVEQRHEEVVRAEAALGAARATLDEEQEALLKKAVRAHAYLKVYAESDPALGAQVDALVPPRSRRAPRAEPTAGQVDGEAAPRKRGRPRKAPTPAGSLFSGHEVAGTDPASVGADEPGEATAPH